MTPDRVRRTQELRRSSSAQPHRNRKRAYRPADRRSVQREIREENEK